MVQHRRDQADGMPSGTQAVIIETRGLAEALCKIEATFGNLRKKQPAEAFPYPSPPYFDSDGCVLMHPTLAAIVDALCKVDAFAKLDKVHVRDGGTGSHQVPLPFFAASLAARTLETGDPAMVATDFAKLVETNEAEAWFVGVLTGLSISNPIDLFDDVKLVPFVDLPATGHKRNLSLRAAELRKHAAIMSAPSSALILRYRIPELFVWGDTPPQPLPDHDRKVYRLRDIADCLMVGSASPVGICAEWFNVAEPAAPRLADYVMTQDPDVAFLGSFETGKFDLDATVPILTSYESFSGDLAGLRLAMKHLRRAWRRSMSFDDKAIDIGIALEVLLAHGSRQEIRHRVGIRGAWLLGESVDERAEINKVITALYDMRSGAVHSGHAPVSVKINGERVRIFDAIERSYQLLGRIYAAILAHGDWPDWNRLVLGSPAAKSSNASSTK